jgi:DNA-binding NarL/FixJ family response regulator
MRGGLTERERKILQFLADGASTRDIAAKEYLALNTVRSYVQSALWKLGAHTRLQAVAVARDLGLI